MTKRFIVRVLLGMLFGRRAEVVDLVSGLPVATFHQGDSARYRALATAYAKKRNAEITQGEFA